MRRRSAQLLIGSTLWVLLSCQQIALAQKPGSGLARLRQPMQAPEFSLDDLDGKRHRLGDFRGRIVVVSFWATWCPPCRAEMPSMQRAFEALRIDDVVFLGVNVGEDEETVFRFTADYPVGFPLLMDTDSRVVSSWPVRGLPTSFVVDPAGQIVFRAIGGREWDTKDILESIRSLRALR